MRWGWDLCRTKRRGRDSNPQAPFGAHAFQACALPFGAPLHIKQDKKTHTSHSNLLFQHPTSINFFFVN